MEDNRRPMFIIKNAKEISLHKNATTSDLLAEVEGNGETKIEATENIAGFGNRQLKNINNGKQTIWQKITTAVIDNLVRIIIGVLGVVLLGLLNHFL